MATPGIAVPGTVVPIGSLTTPGGAQGIQGPTAVSADAGNIATLGSDSLVLVPQQTIWYQRLRSYNAIGNPTFEVDQRNVGNTLVNPASGTLTVDRWRVGKSVSTMAINVAQTSTGAGAVVPGTNFYITAKTLWINLTAQQATLAATDQWQVIQAIEGPRFRELSLDVHSLSILGSTNVAGGLKFGLTIRDNPVTRCLTKLCTIPAAGVNTLITLPNLPVFASGGNWTTNPGVNAYEIVVCLAAGSSQTTPANDAWQNGSFVGAVGQDNFAAKAVGATLNLLFVQHEPGPLCSTLIDYPFDQNYHDCLRYFCKSYDYATAIGATAAPGAAVVINPLAAVNSYIFGRHSFPRPMAKDPTIGIYNSATGAVNSARQAFTTTDWATTAVSAGQTGFNTLPLSGSMPANAALTFHFTAETGW